MAIQKVTYEDKVDLKIWASIPNTNKIKADDMNEIKGAINENADELSKSQKDITSQNKQLQILTNALPSETQEGESINIKGTVPVKFKEFVVKGNSKQKTREGYNLLNTPSELEITGYQRLSVDLKANNTYTLKFDDAIPSENNDSSLIRFIKNNDEDATDSQTVNTSINKKVIIATTENITQILIYSNLDYVSSQGKSKTFVNLMIYKGTEDKDYEPYGAMPSPEFISKIQNIEGDVNVTVANKEKTEQQTVTFPLSEGQKLYKGDYLADDGIHHVRKQIELDGTEDWKYYSSHQFEGFYTAITEDIKTNANFSENNSLCNYFNTKNIEYIRKNADNLLFSSQYATYITISNNIASNVSELKEWVKKKKSDGAPAILEYELAEEEIETYTEEQKEAYNKLKQLTAYEEETNIYSTNEVSPIFKVTAVKDVNSVITQLNQLILEGGK